MKIEDPKQQAAGMVDKLRQDMGVGKPGSGSQRESAENVKVKKACEVFNAVLGSSIGTNLNSDKPLTTEERSKLADKVGLQLNHVAEGTYPLGRDRIQELLPALETLGFTTEEVSEIKLCKDLFVDGRNSKEAWDDYAKKFAK